MYDTFVFLKTMIMNIVTLVEKLFKCW